MCLSIGSRSQRRCLLSLARERPCSVADAMGAAGPRRFHIPQASPDRRGGYWCPSGEGGGESGRETPHPSEGVEGASHAEPGIGCRGAGVGKPPRTSSTFPRLRGPPPARRGDRVSLQIDLKVPVAAPQFARGSLLLTTSHRQNVVGGMSASDCVQWTQLPFSQA